ncbi:MAG: MinD/ParA family protein [Rhodospirillales bacterium]
MSEPPITAPTAGTRAKGRNMIAIASGKGGVGKTWFSITLAHALANSGKRVLLFDGDLGLANLDIQLGLMPKSDLGGVIGGKLTLGQAITHYPEGGFDVIAGRSGSGTLADLPTNRVRMLADDLAQIAPSYDVVLIDLGAGIERTVRIMANYAGRCVVVLTDEPTSLTDAYAFIKVSHTERPEADIRIVANMVNSTREGERTYNTLVKACQGFLHFTPPLLGIVRRDGKVREAIRSQTSILTRYPNAEAATDVEGIADTIASEL